MYFFDICYKMIYIIKCVAKRRKEGPMDIAALSMSLAQANLQTSVGYAMMDKTLNLQSQEGASLTKMIDAAAMERSVNPSVGSTLDISI